MRGMEGRASCLDGFARAIPSHWYTAIIGGHIGTTTTTAAVACGAKASAEPSTKPRAEPSAIGRLLYGEFSIRVPDALALASTTVATLAQSTAPSTNGGASANALD